MENHHCHLHCEYCRQRGHPIPHTPALPRYPSCESCEQLAPSLPAPPPRHRVIREGLPLAARSILHTDDPHIFRSQEREYLSRPTSWFCFPIQIDVPQNPQAIGGYYPPPRFITLPSRLPQPLRLPPSPASHNVPPPQRQTSSDGANNIPSTECQGRR